jgi:TPP-dependent pyruvate/acetoin dehydrogenase alpha subunit
MTRYETILHRNAPFDFDLNAPRLDADRRWTVAGVQAVLLDGNPVVPVGQLSKAAAAWLRRAEKAGQIEAFACHSFPAPRTAYRLAA